MFKLCLKFMFLQKKFSLSVSHEYFFIYIKVIIFWILYIYTIPYKYGKQTKSLFFYQIYKVWIKPEILSVQASKLMKYSCLYVYINCLHNWCFWKKIKKKSRNFFFGQKPRKILTKKKMIFLLSFVGQKFLGNRQTQKKFVKMNTKVHENNFRNFKYVNIIKIGWYFWS